MKKPMQNMMQVERFDNLYTPEEAVYPILKYLPTSATFYEVCDPGNSKITSVIKESGRKVISSDITTGTNFLEDPFITGYDEWNEFCQEGFIITNPPYSLKDKFLDRCYKLEVPFALLLPLTTLEGIRRGNMFRNKGISVVVLNKRIDFTGKGANWFNVSWFIYNLSGESSLYFEEVN